VRVRHVGVMSNGLQRLDCTTKAAGPVGPEARGAVARESIQYGHDFADHAAHVVPVASARD
jgi:hypothetical protein